MVANVNGPQFSGGANIAIKCPTHTYEQTIRVLSRHARACR